MNLVAEQVEAKVNQSKKSPVLMDIAKKEHQSNYKAKYVIQGTQRVVHWKKAYIEQYINSEKKDKNNETKRIDKKKIHVNSVHLKKDTYSCSYCARTYSTKGNLTRHVKTIHEVPKSFVCHYCNATYTRADNLTRHIKDTCHYDVLY